MKTTNQLTVGDVVIWNQRRAIITRITRHPGGAASVYLNGCGVILASKTDEFLVMNVIEVING